MMADIELLQEWSLEDLSQKNIDNVVYHYNLMEEVDRKQEEKQVHCQKEGITTKVQP